MSDSLGESAVSSVDHKARKSKETWILLFQLWLVVLPPTYRISSADSANSDSKTHMLLVVKELPECGFGILVLFFLFSKRFNTLTLHLFALYIPFPPLFIPIIIPVV